MNISAALSIIRKKSSIIPEKKLAKVMQMTSLPLDEGFNAIPDELKLSFLKLEKINGKKFLKTAYKELVKYTGLEEVAPKRLKIKKLDPGIGGAYSWLYHKISVSKYLPKTSSKASQLGTIAHELKHLEQSCSLIRCENIGLKNYIDNICENMVYQNKKSLFNLGFYSEYCAAQKKGLGDAFLAEEKNNYMMNMGPIMKKKFHAIDKLPKTKCTPEIQELIDKRLEGIKTYIQPDWFEYSQKLYFNNPLEVEAREAGQQVENYFYKFLSALNKTNQKT